MTESNERDSRRNESDREDIMREATALRRRASFAVEGLPEPIVAGFRARDFFSVFFDQDPVYQFDDNGRLRRAYRNGLLYRTQGSTLARLTRVRTKEQTELQRTDLTADELAEFLNEMRGFIEALLAALESGVVPTEKVPADADFSSEIIAALEATLQTTDPLAPAFPTRR